MLQKYRYIKNIKEIVREKLEQLKLKPALELSEFIKKNKRFYSVTCFRGNKKIFLKLLLVQDIGPVEGIRKEIAIHKFLKKFRRKLNFPRLIKYDNRNIPYWYLRKYIEGKLLGDFYNLNLTNKKYIPQLINFLFSLQQIPKIEIKKIVKKKEFFLWKRDFAGYLKIVKSYQEEIKQDLSKKINFSKIYQLFEKGKNSFEKSPLVLAHGDFTLANFIVSNKRVVVADWEHAHLDNFAYDLSRLWIQLWRYPLWQKELISEFISRLPERKREEFKKVFRVVVISEALGELRWSINLCEKKYKIGATQSALKTIKKALRGFYYLI